MDANSHSEELHHAAPRCLTSLHEKANGVSLDGEGIQAWVEWEMEALRWRVPVEISREDLEALVEASEVILEREQHRLLYASNWQRWGSRGGRETLRRYGNEWFALLGPEAVESDNRRGPRRGEGPEVRRSDLGGARVIVPLGERAGMVLKPPEMVCNERKGR